MCHQPGTALTRRSVGSCELMLAARNGSEAPASCSLSDWGVKAWRIPGNAVFLGVVRAGGKGQVGDGDRLETSVVVHGSPVAFRLTSYWKPTSRNAAVLSHLTRQIDCGCPSWVCTEANRSGSSGRTVRRVHLKRKITDIAVELVTTAEINYREACMRRHLWVAGKREALKARLDDERRTAKRTIPAPLQRRGLITWSLWQRTIGKLEPSAFSSVPCDDAHLTQMAHWHEVILRIGVTGLTNLIQ
jgi:hypothetical protein